MDAPNDYKQAGMFMMIAGIINLVYGILWVFLGCYTCLSTLGVCFLCPIIALVPLGFGIYELITGMKINKGELVPNAKQISIFGVVIGAICMNVITLVLEVLAMTNFGKPEVVEWMERGAPIDV